MGTDDRENGVTESVQDRLFADALALCGAAIARMARAYEADPDQRRDLEQDIQVALWQSLAGFQGQCALSSWVWRVAHNRAMSHVLRQSRLRRRNWVNIENLALESDLPSPSETAENGQAMALILAIVDRLTPPDRQIMLLYLEGVAGAEIAEIAGVSSDLVTTKVHRFKTMLTRRFADAGEGR